MADQCKICERWFDNDDELEAHRERVHGTSLDQFAGGGEGGASP